MSTGVTLSPCNAVNKTRNAILRMKKCSPELRTVLRQRCQERIQNDRLKTLSAVRNAKIQDCFKIAFGNILKEDWKCVEDEVGKPQSKWPSSGECSLDEELLLEELLEKELTSQHDDWLLQLYEEFLSEDTDDPCEIVCPLCCSGYLEQVQCGTYNRTQCMKCSGNFVAEKSLFDLQKTIYEQLAYHDQQCSFSSAFVSIPKSESENNLCIVCHHCSHLNVIE